MEWPLVLLIIMGSLTVLMLSGMPVAFCFLVVNIVGVFVFWGGTTGYGQLILSIFDSVTRFSLVSLPLFVMMGELMFRSGIGSRLVDTVDKSLGRLPGRLALVAVGTGTLFSVMSGSSMASVALLGTTLVPEMEKRGYKKPMSIGPVMGSGGLAMIIPPSGIIVLLGAIAEISVGKLLIGGVIPGLIIACLYASYIIIRCYLQPSIAPPYELTPVPLLHKLVLIGRYVLPLGLIIFLVLGLIFLGVATPTEAAASGALGALFLAACYRRLTWEVIKKSVIGTMEISIMLFMILTGAMAFSQILSFSGASLGLIELAVGLPLAPIMLFISMQVIVAFLGTFMSIVPIMIIVLPMYMPIVYAMGWDPIWFGIIMLVNMEMASTTPPFGMLLYVMRGVAPPGTTFGDIVRAGLPFLLCDFTAIVLFIAFPILVLWLPNMII